MDRNENKRLRIGNVEVFEDFCMVTQSVREGIDVKVNVSRPPAAG